MIYPNDKNIIIYNVYNCNRGMYFLFTWSWNTYLENVIVIARGGVI